MKSEIICGESLEVLSGMESESVDMAITSPPYWGLRDYGTEQIFGGDAECEHDFGIIHRRAGDKSGPHGPGSMLGPTKHAQHGVRKGEPTKTCLKCNAWKGQLGLEPTPELYIEHMTAIFHEVKRVLKKEGTLWLNIGDTYATHGGCKNSKHSHNFRPPDVAEREGIYRGGKPYGTAIGLQEKCLTMIPERLAWSLIQDGWILRNKIVWYKPNAMPSSVKDRLSNKWEYLFMFSKARKYHFDLDSIREPHKYDGRKDTKYKGGFKDVSIGKHERWPNPIGKNPGDVLEMPSETRTLGAIMGDSGAVKIPGGKGWIGHPPGGEHALRKDPRWCPPEGKNPGDYWEVTTQSFPEAHFAVFPERLCERPIKAGCPKNGVVLDPFCGAGTAGVVAKKLGRQFIGIELKSEYCEMAKKRIAKVGYQKELF